MLLIDLYFEVYAVLLAEASRKNRDGLNGGKSAITTLYLQLQKDDGLKR